MEVWLSLNGEVVEGGAFVIGSAVVKCEAVDVGALVVGTGR